MLRYDLVIIGGGAAGSEAAFTVADGGKHRILIAESSHFGGTCTNHGCVPTKALVHAAKLAHDARESERFGIHVGPVRIDWSAVMARAGEVRDHMLRFGSQPFIDAGVEVRFPARAVLVGDHQVAIDGEVVEASAVLLAAGLEAAVPPIPGLVETGFVDNEGALELAELPRRMAIIGSGPIGCEFAQIFARLGVQVTIVDAGSRILAVEEPESSAALRDAFVAERIVVRAGARIASVSRQPAGLKRIEFASGPALEVDEILLAVGRSLDGASLGLDTAGVEWGPKGVKVDSHLRTTASWVWAAGDVVGGPLFTHVASAEGPIAARNALGMEGGEVDLRIVPRVTFTDPEVASVGLSEAAAEAAGYSVRVGRALLADAEKAQIDGERFGHVKVVADAATGQLLGCAIVASTAGDMIHEAVALMAGRVPVAAAAAAMHAYPTLSELTRTALYGAAEAAT